MTQEQILFTLSREDSLDCIQKYLEKNSEALNKKDISNEMFSLFFLVIELGKEIRISLKEKTYLDTELKIADIFLILISICNHLNINLFDALTKKEQILNGKVAKWF